jgi:AraC-like DNA-binding protein
LLLERAIDADYGTNPNAEYQMRRLGGNDLDLLEQLFEQLPDSPFFVKNGALQYAAANSAMARLCGLRRPEELYGKTASELFPPFLSTRYEAMDRQVIKSGRALTNIVDQTLNDTDRPVWLIFARVPLLDETGQCAGVVCTSRRLAPGEGAAAGYARLARVAQQIRDAMDQPLHLRGLARIAGISASQLERDFARLFRLTPREFLQQVRMQRALELLDTNRTIAEIAYECGYADHSAFTRRFRRLVGMSPREYRQRRPAG